MTNAIDYNFCRAHRGLVGHPQHQIVGAIAFSAYIPHIIGTRVVIGIKKSFASPIVIAIINRGLAQIGTKATTRFFRQCVIRYFRQ